MSNDVEYYTDEDGRRWARVELDPAPVLMPEWRAVLLSDRGEIVSDSVPTNRRHMHWNPDQIRPALVASYLLYDHVMGQAVVARVDVPMHTRPGNSVDLDIGGSVR